MASTALDVGPREALQPTKLLEVVIGWTSEVGQELGCVQGDRGKSNSRLLVALSAPLRVVLRCPPPNQCAAAAAALSITHATPTTSTILSF